MTAKSFGVRINILDLNAAVFRGFHCNRLEALFRLGLFCWPAVLSRYTGMVVLSGLWGYFLSEAYPTVTRMMVVKITKTKKWTKISWVNIYFSLGCACSSTLSPPSHYRIIAATFSDLPTFSCGLQPLLYCTTVLVMVYCNITNNSPVVQYTTSTLKTGGRLNYFPNSMLFLLKVCQQSYLQKLNSSRDYKQTATSKSHSTEVYGWWFSI